LTNQQQKEKVGTKYIFLILLDNIWRLSSSE